MAMSNQASVMMQQHQGDFAAAAAAMTPGGPPASSPVQATNVPSGFIPNAKRPMDPSTIHVAAGGATAMSVEDLSQGFANMGVTQQKTEQFALNIANCVHYHGELLNALVTCVNKIEARAVQLQAQQRQQRVQLSDRLHSRRASTKLYDKKTAQADEKVEALTRDVRHAIGTVDDGDKQRDGILRAELSANPSMYS